MRCKVGVCHDYMCDHLQVDMPEKALPQGKEKIKSGVRMRDARRGTRVGSGVRHKSGGD